MHSLTRLQVENFKRISFVSITPQQRSFVIAGVNDAGKSSVMDAIVCLLCGERLSPEQPIREGEDSAVICATLSGDMNYEVERTFSRKRSGAIISKLKVTGVDGAVASPQSVLNAILGSNSIAFDPLAFCRMKSKEQSELLLQLAGVDLAAENTARAEIFSKRTSVVRDGKAAKARLGGMTRHEDAPEIEVSVADLMTELERREDVNAGNSKSRALLEAAGKEVEVAVGKVVIAEDAVVLARLGLEEVKGRLDATRNTLDKATLEAAGVRSAVDQLTDEGTDDIRQQINNAEAVNQQVRDNAAYVKAEHEVQALLDSHQSLTRQIESADAKKATTLAGLDLPIADLACDEEGVTLAGLPLGQASKSEQIKTGMAVGIAQNPGLKLMMIADGSLLGDDSLATIDAMADKAGMLVLIEYAMRNEGDEVPCEIVIEDGTVRAATEANDND